MEGTNFKNWKHGSHHAIDTIKSPVYRKKTKLKSSATTLYCITQVSITQFNMTVFYREVLLPFRKFKYACVSHPTKFRKYSIA